jgi:hypothetical protein
VGWFDGWGRNLIVPCFLAESTPDFAKRMSARESSRLLDMMVLIYKCKATTGIHTASIEIHATAQNEQRRPLFPSSESGHQKH